MIPSAQEKIRARSQVMIALEAGRMEKRPCSVCGNIPAEAHHADYSRPLEVMWLCKPHHARIHASPETEVIRIRVTKSDKKRLLDEAMAQLRSLTQFVRLRLGLRP